MAAASPIPGHIRLVGRTCDKPIQVGYSKDYRRVAPFGAHPYDDHWIALSVTTGPADDKGVRKYELRWELGPDVELCPGGWTRLGYGNREAITMRNGSRLREVSARGPVGIKVNARFKQDIRMRDGLGPARLRRIVAGWARRECSLPPGGAARVLESLVERVGGSACKAPARVHATATELLRHLTARFNAEGSTDDNTYGREYYRVLGQLTTYRR
ncbi:hypothetical protein LRS13_09515 [Svornostia abyssi]|uniref:Uncharacterized protein n=1 Tax=Svornostia abyssi TaxID=2898438 RepID=A0ABY5PN44_9ACTN|nr:hypothetical protein LRS13_09515 [Parviterribacteraceae bacterium J379]